MNENGLQESGATKCENSGEMEAIKEFLFRGLLPLASIISALGQGQSPA
jgi:hypothetical protein